MIWNLREPCSFFTSACPKYANWSSISALWLPRNWNLKFRIRCFFYICRDSTRILANNSVEVVFQNLGICLIMQICEIYHTCKESDIEHKPSQSIQILRVEVSASNCRLSIESWRENDQIAGKEEQNPRTLSLTWENESKKQHVGSRRPSCQ